jgi:hypothetical protein
MTKILPVFVNNIIRSITINAFAAHALAGNREITLKAGFDECDT